jgi:hypothetical protein
VIPPEFTVLSDAIVRKVDEGVVEAAELPTIDAIPIQRVTSA